MDIKLSPSILSGEVSSIASKSDVHRLMICALQCSEAVVIKGVSRCADIDATAACVSGLGADVKIEGRTCTVTPSGEKKDKILLDCGESGSTLRFLLPVAAVVSNEPSLRVRADFLSAPSVSWWMPCGQTARSFQGTGCPLRCRAPSRRASMFCRAM